MLSSPSLSQALAGAPGRPVGGCLVSRVKESLGCGRYSSPAHGGGTPRRSDLDLDPTLAPGTKTMHEGERERKDRERRAKEGRVRERGPHCIRAVKSVPLANGSSLVIAVRKRQSPRVGSRESLTSHTHLYGGWLRNAATIYRRAFAAWAPRRRRCLLFLLYVRGADIRKGRVAFPQACDCARLRPPCSEYVRVCVRARVCGPAGVRVGRDDAPAVRASV